MKAKKKRKKKLTIREERACQAYVASGGSYKQAAIAAPYPAKGEPNLGSAYRSISRERCQERIKELLDAQNLTAQRMLGVGSEGLDAMKIHGTADDFIDTEDWPSRYKFWDKLWDRLGGVLGLPTLKQGAGPTNTNIVIYTPGRVGDELPIHRVKDGEIVDELLTHRVISGEIAGQE